MKYKSKVILCSSQTERPLLWLYWDFGTANGNPVADWYESLSIEAQDKLDELLKNNAKIETPIHWVGFKFMQGALKDEKIWQLSVHDAGGQVRLLGIFSNSKRKEAILLLGCFHKDKVYTPHNALETASSRARDVRNGRVKLYERQVSTDF